MKLAVTTSKKPKRNQHLRAEQVAKDLTLPLIVREQRSVEALFNHYQIDYLFVVEKDKLLITNRSESFFWHPGTAIKKLWEISLGKNNSLQIAADLKAGSSVLDCTLGFGSDAILMACIVGDKGKVVGIEANEYIAYLTRDGLENYTQVKDYIKYHMNQIKVVHDTYQSYLSALPDNSFDVVYFDPMFRMPNKASHGINGLREFALEEPLSIKIITEALRVCKNRVVVKERIGSGVFKELGIINRIGEIKFGSVVYGYIEKLTKNT